MGSYDAERLRPVINVAPTSHHASLMLLVALHFSLALALQTGVQQPVSRQPVRAEHLATAFRDDRARELFYRARKARMAQDSSLRSYDARVRTRVSIAMRFGETGRERMLYRQESASRVRWQHDVGAARVWRSPAPGSPLRSCPRRRSETSSW